MAPQIIATESIIRPTHLALFNEVEQKIMENLPLATQQDIIKDSDDEVEDEEWKEERLITEITCNVATLTNDKETFSLKILIRFEDSMNRELNKNITKHQTGLELATELVFYGLINEVDLTRLAITIQNGIDSYRSS